MEVEVVIRSGDLEDIEQSIVINLGYIIFCVVCCAPVFRGKLFGLVIKGLSTNPDITEEDNAVVFDGRYCSSKNVVVVRVGGSPLGVPVPVFLHLWI